MEVSKAGVTSPPSSVPKAELESGRGGRDSAPTVTPTLGGAAATEKLAPLSCAFYHVALALPAPVRLREAFHVSPRWSAHETTVQGPRLSRQADMFLSGAIT